MKRSHRKPVLVSLKGRGWAVIGDSIAVIRLRDRPGFAVGVQDAMRSGGVGRVWPGLKMARRRAAKLSTLNNLPIVEAL